MEWVKCRYGIMKKNISIILSLIAFVAVLGVILVWIFRGYTISVVSLDTFIGVMVAIVGLLVTFAVGWQIVNALEIRNKINEIERVKDAMNTLKEQISETLYETKYESYFVRSQEAYVQNEYMTSSIYAMQALLAGLGMRANKDVAMVLNILQTSLQKMVYTSLEDPNAYKELISFHKSVKDTPKYVVHKT